MNVLKRAIENNQHILNDSQVNNQTWSRFFEAARGKNVVIFGIGIITENCLKRIKNQVKITDIVDNDSKKWNMSACNFFSPELENVCKDIVIQNPEILSSYDPENVVVLISSIRYYSNIQKQLEEMGIKNHYVMFVMEAKEQYSNTESDANKHIINPKKIVFNNGISYSGHEKYILNQLLKLRNDLDIVYISGDLSVEIPAGVRVIHNKNISACEYEMSTAKIVVDDYSNFLPDKALGQIYIEVKHWASVTLKTFGLDMSAVKKNPQAVEREIRFGKLLDYAIGGGDFDEKSMRTGFLFEGKWLPFGSSRSDILFGEQDFKRMICQRYNIPEDKKLVVYAPTFRLKIGCDGYIPESKICLDFEKIKNALDNTFGGDWYILLRLHPNVAVESKNIPKPDYVIDVSDYSDSQELVAASEIMITDYSSIMFEPAFVRKPVFLFAPDIDEYVANERDFLIDYYTLPFSRAKSNDELVKNIKNFNNESYIKEVDLFMAKYDVHEDGHASERCAKFISDLIDGK